ncbi:hypothetical protein [Kushneria phyllosphaerae]|uniref:Uncharacterized protein n=1 Tax=Kushneria phyllosphaerae TaxID=2100822 RepID=A0A2R8CIX5_9GAMM|nr:hypothetical protein [Kushneria phyllosphaerae]SPJ32694.1 hypothetical protein KSP9073_00695 [Kushneria phyllosphaerae]
MGKFDGAAFARAYRAFMNEQEEPETPPESTPEDNEQALEDIRERLRPILYNDEMIDEFAPVFFKLKDSEQVEQIYSLLESKESQIKELSSGDYFKQESSPEDKQEHEDSEESEEDAINYVDQILQQRYNDN